jgi:hypothetical protein
VSIWQLTRLTGQKRRQYTDANGNTVVSTTAEMSVWRVAKPYETREQLFVYRTVDGSWTAQLNGTEGGDKTHWQSQDEWEAMHTSAVAAHALLGRLPDMTHEIVLPPVTRS